MKQKTITENSLPTPEHTSKNQSSELLEIDSIAHQLHDVMEIIDSTELKEKLIMVENDYQKRPNEINKARLGIIYHEVALNLSFLSKTEFKGYAQKSFEVLSGLVNSPQTLEGLMPFLTSYRASALSLVCAETKKLSLLTEAFTLFESAISNYSRISYLPEFLRGSVAENLPWFFFSKRKFAKKDFDSIIDKYHKDQKYANWKIMSFTYLSWAKQRQTKKHRTQSLIYLDYAISLDPHYKAGRAKAETLKMSLLG